MFLKKSLTHMNVFTRILALVVWALITISVHAAVKTWRGITNTLWTTASNWDGGVPTAEDDVVIPAGLLCYPTAEDGSVCRYIYIESGARLAGQEQLTYEKAFVDVTIPANRYVRFVPPLQEVYTGDLFTKEQGGEWTDFSDTHFTGNRVEPGSTYISLFAQIGINYDAYYNIEARSATTTWADPFNYLAHDFIDAESFDVWIDNGEDEETTATFHFPGGDTEYRYFSDAGVEGETEAMTRTDARGHFIFDNGTVGSGFQYRNFPSNGTAMFATGNPTMGLMSVKLFMEENVLTHKNITPFIYRHNNVFADKGTESIIYYNAASKRLFSVSGSVADDEVPPASEDGEIGDDDARAYIQPNEGFRLMSGETTVFSIEPQLLGNYVPEFRGAKCEYEYYGVPTHYDLRDHIKYGKASSTNETGTNSTYDMSVAITATPDPKVVCISNFVRRGYVYAHIDKDNHTLTIPNGSPVFYLAEGYWHEGQLNRNLQENRTVCIYGCSSETPEFEQTIRYGYITSLIHSLYETKMVTNLHTDVVLDYAFTGGGDSIRITSRRPFVLYSYQFAMENADMAYHDVDEAEAYWVYKRVIMEKAVNRLEDDFILPEALGGFSVDVYEKEGSPAGGVSAGDVNDGVTVSRLKGVYDYVLVDGIYPAVYNHPVIGRISDGEAQMEGMVVEHYYELEGGSGIKVFEWLDILDGREWRYDVHVTAKQTKYKMTVLNGQLINEIDADDISQNYFWYYKDRQYPMQFHWYTDVVITKQKQRWHLIGGWKNTDDPPIVETLPDRWQQTNEMTQVSHLDSNPNGSEFPGFYLSTQNNCVFTHIREAEEGTYEAGGEPGGSAGEIIISGDINQPHPIVFGAEMFAANRGDFASRLTDLQAMPARRAQKALKTTPMMNIKAETADGKTANTMIICSESAHDGFNRFEDAPLFDAGDAAFTFATLAGQQIVGVNVLPEWTNIPLFLTRDAKLTFYGVQSYGNRLVLYDAVNEQEFPLEEGGQYSLTINENEQAGRWFLRTPSGMSATTALSNINDDTPLCAWNPEPGTLVVRTASVTGTNVSLYGMSGQRVASIYANDLAVFHNIPLGTYVVVVVTEKGIRRLKTSIQ